jgi:hypothetical protein
MVGFLAMHDTDALKKQLADQEQINSKTNHGTPHALKNILAQGKPYTGSVFNK